MTPDPALRGRVRIVAARAVGGGRRAVAMILDGAPDTTVGAGGWQAIDRPQQGPAHWWAGRPEQSITLQGIIEAGDPADPGRSVENRVLILTALGRRQGAQSTPTPVRLRGDVRDVHSVRGGLWVITGLVMGERLWFRDGRLRRQMVTVSLTEFDPVTSVKAVSVRRTRTTAAKPRARTITVRKGDTLRTIAVRELGQSTAWQAIRTWNPKRFKGKSIGADEPLKAGIRLVLK